MDKVLRVVVNKEEQLIKYKKGVGGKGNTVYTVETTIVNLERFQFFIENGRAAFMLTTPAENSIKTQIMNQIKANEMKR